MTIKQTALITGASGGIGLELAHVFAREGYNLVLVARSADKLTALAESLTAEFGISAMAHPADLTDPAAPDALFAAMQEKGITVDVLVNNAGFATFGYFAETDLQRELDEIQLNVTALTHLCKLFGREMVTRRRGGILNVASIAAFQPGPLMAVYYATKAYVLSFSEALANEMADFGVTVSVLCPGATVTDFFDRAEMGNSGMMKNLRMMSAKDVAEIGYRGFVRGKTVVIPGFMNRLLVFSTRLASRKITAKIARRLQAPQK